MSAVDWLQVFRAVHTARWGEDDRVRRVRALMDRAYATPLTVDALAAEAHLSRAQLMRTFRRAYETTPHQYLVRRRLDAALELLETTEMSVTDVCFSVGFSSVGSFSDLFRRHYGYAPSRYRRLSIVSLGLVPPSGAPCCFAWIYGGRPQVPSGAP